MKDCLERAIAIAVEAHAGQLDKAGQPYILHPIRVMQRVHGTPAKIVAILHDVVEDGEGWTFERLAQEGFGDDVLEPLKLVTKPEGLDTKSLEGYLIFVRRTIAHPVALMVKLADLEDNLDITRLSEISEKDVKRLNKYLAARRELLSHLPTS